MCTIFTNYELVELVLAHFSPRKQLDYKADRWAEAVYQKIEAFRQLRRRKPAQVREPKPYKKQEFTSVKNALKIPLDHKIVKPNFAPEGTPIPEFSFKNYNLNMHLNRRQQ